jgi:hypothetical protein
MSVYGPPLPPWSRDGAAAFGGIIAALINTNNVK